MAATDLGYWRKDPDAELDFAFDWGSDWLDEGDTITVSLWSVSPDGLDVIETAPRQPSYTATTTTVWLAGGTDGQDYQITNRIVTTGGRTDEKTRRVVVRSH